MRTEIVYLTLVIEGDILAVAKLYLLENQLMKSFNKVVIRRASYFTMVEMLGVVAIVAILIGLVFGSYRAIQIRENNIRAEAVVNSIHTALQAFKTKYGYYPQTGSNPMALVICKGTPSTSSSLGINGSPDYIDGNHLVLGQDFINFLSTDTIHNFSVEDGYLGSGTHTSPAYILTDGMDEPVTNSKSELSNIRENVSTLYYRCPGRDNPLTYDLFSAGRDREFHTNDDVWPKNLRKAK